MGARYDSQWPGEQERTKATDGLSAVGIPASLTEKVPADLMKNGDCCIAFSLTCASTSEDVMQPAQGDGRVNWMTRPELRRMYSISYIFINANSGNNWKPEDQANQAQSSPHHQ